MAPDAIPIRSSNREIARAYDRLAGLYDRVVTPFEGGTRRATIDLLDPRPGERILEVGCGPGHALARVAGAVGTDGLAVGLDAAPGMVSRARERSGVAEANAPAAVVLGDARSLPLADGTVDAVLIADTLELFDAGEVAGVLAEVRRVLRPDGRLCVATMERAGHERSPFVVAYEWAYEHLPGYETVGCRPIYARRALVEAGFRIETAERRHHAWIWPVDLFLARPGAG